MAGFNEFFNAVTDIKNKIDTKVEAFHEKYDAWVEKLHETTSRVYSTPVINNIVGQLTLSFNQMWQNFHEYKGIYLQEMIKKIDANTPYTEEELEKIKSMPEKPRGRDRLKQKAMQKLAHRLLSKKNKLQGKLQHQAGKSTIYIAQRNMIAEKLIKQHQNKLTPIEEKISTYKAKLDLLTEKYNKPAELKKEIVELKDKIKELTKLNERTSGGQKGANTRRIKSMLNEINNINFELPAANTAATSMSEAEKYQIILLTKKMNAQERKAQRWRARINNLNRITKLNQKVIEVDSLTQEQQDTIPTADSYQMKDPAA